MLSTLLVIGGVLVGLLVLLALIVSLSARPAGPARSTTRSGADVSRATPWVADAGRPHPDAWSPPGTPGTTGEFRAVR